MITDHQRLSVLLKVKAAVESGNERAKREAYEKIVRAEIAKLPESQKTAFLNAEISKIPVEEERVI